MQQLDLPLDASDADLAATLPARLAMPVATEGGAPFDDESRLFSPWWPGAHAMVRRHGDQIEITTDHLSDPIAAFPELQDIRGSLVADGLIVEGTLLALDKQGRPDAGLLRRRLSQAAGWVRTAASALEGEGAFVAFDVPYVEGRSIRELPYRERRQRLAAVLDNSARCVMGPGLIGEGQTMGRAVAALGLTGISAHRLDARWRSGRVGDDWLHLRVSEEASEPTRPFLVLLERLPLGD